MQCQAHRKCPTTGIQDYLSNDTEKQWSQGDPHFPICCQPQDFTKKKEYPGSLKIWKRAQAHLETSWRVERGKSSEPIPNHNLLARMRGAQGAALSSHILWLALGVSTKLYSLTPRERPRQGLRQSVSRELFQSGESKTKEGLRAWDPARALHRDSSPPRSIKSPGDSSVGQKTIKCTQTQHSKISTQHHLSSQNWHNPHTLAPYPPPPGDLYHGCLHVQMRKLRYTMAVKHPPRRLYCKSNHNTAPNSLVLESAILTAIPCFCSHWYTNYWKHSLAFYGS